MITFVSLFRRQAIFFSLSALLFCSLFPTFAHAQSARWEPSEGSLAFGQTSQLQLIFEGCVPKGRPTLPAIAGLSLQAAGESSQTSIINGSITRSETLSFAARPTKRTDITIPEFSVETDKGRINVASASFTIGQATVGNGVSLESIATSNFAVPATVWTGEAFPIEYTLNVRQRNAPSLENLLGSLLDWKPAPLSTEEWTKPAKRDSLVNGESYITIFQKTRAIIAKPGPATLTEGNQLVNIAKGVDFFGRYVLDQFAITSNKPTINVRPLPSPAPTAFNGAVGQFTLKSNVVPVTASVGEPITWTLTLAGTGNWPDLPGLPARSVSKDFRTVQPQARRTPKEGTLFDASLVEDVVLIPTKPGIYTLGPTTWSYFDPAKGDYQTVTTPAVTVTISAAETSTPTVASTTATTGPSRPAKPPVMPKSIPRDPLPDTGESTAPLARSTFIAALCVPVIALLIFWLWLALRRARETDPLRPRREARTRLAATLETLRTTKDPQRIAALLLAWQKDTAILHQISAAVPAASDFTGGVAPPPRTVSTTATLWADTERALYRDATPLPSDWIARAEQALHESRIKAFSLWQLFRLNNLLPFAALIVIGLTLTSTTLRADAGRAAYDRADFAAAEQAWRTALAQSPTNPALHHNLSLALAQQDRWGEAAAHAAAAFTQQPRDPATRWNLAFALERAGYSPSVFSGFAAEDPPHQLARQFTATEWQLAALLAVSLAAIGGGLLLLRGYGNNARWLKPSALTIFVIAALLGGAAGFSLRVYSPLNDARAVIVWHDTTLRSIPTEVDTAQKTTALPAGTVAIINHTFIPGAWARLSFPNGQTGWLRQEDLVRLWQ
jgi:tetratricopeptide (TPR) repeat protein